MEPNDDAAIAMLVKTMNDALARAVSQLVSWWWYSAHLYLVVFSSVIGNKSAIERNVAFVPYQFNMVLYVRSHLMTLIWNPAG